MNAKQKTFFEKQMEIGYSIGLKELARFRVNVFTQARGVGMVPGRSRPRCSPSRSGSPRPSATSPSSARAGAGHGPDGLRQERHPRGHDRPHQQEPRGHILTVEDPIEFVHQADRCIINQREIGAHTLLANALRSALREDPDVILVGELRDLETVSLALTAAETGHLVFGTLHTNSAPGPSTAWSMPTPTSSRPRCGPCSRRRCRR